MTMSLMFMEDTPLLEVFVFDVLPAFGTVSLCNIWVVQVIDWYTIFICHS